MAGSIQMRFFVPGCEGNEEKAEKDYAHIRKSTSQMQNRKLSCRRIYSLKWDHDSKRCEATVGGAAPPDPTSGQAGRVLAIFESSDGDLYYVVVAYGSQIQPYPMVGLNEVRAVEWFEGYV